MVMPLTDDNTGRRTFPVVNYVLIALNVLVFALPQRFGEDVQFTYAFSTVPREIVTGKDVVTGDRQIDHPMTGQVVTVPGLQQTPGSVYLTLLTSMFMHGSLLHLLGNMLFLWIFGDNVEDDLGHVRYLIFYLLCGVLASLAHVFTTVVMAGADSEQALIPSLGASGAISGVLGGYLLLHPQNRVLVLLLRVVVWAPAYVAIGLWFVFQVVSGLGALGEGAEKGGVAYMAHIGGFVAGLALVKLFAVGRDVQARQATRVARWSPR